jgi:hypothetical protein
MTIFLHWSHAALCDVTGCNACREDCRGTACQEVCPGHTACTGECSACEMERRCAQPTNQPTNQPTAQPRCCCFSSFVTFVVFAAASRRKFFLVGRGQASVFQQVAWHWSSPCHTAFRRTWAMEPATSSALRMGALSMGETVAPAHQSASCGKVMASAMLSVMTAVPVRSRTALIAPTAAHLSK